MKQDFYDEFRSIEIFEPFITKSCWFKAVLRKWCTYLFSRPTLFSIQATEPSQASPIQINILTEYKLINSLSTEQHCPFLVS